MSCGFGVRIAIVVVQLLSCIWLFAIPLPVGCQSPLSSTVSQSLLKLMSTVHLLLKLMSISVKLMSVMLSSHLILCCPFLHLPSVFPSLKVFSNESVLCIRWPKCWSFIFSKSPSNVCSGLISFRSDWFDLLAVQGTLKNPLQHNSKA